MSGATPDAPSPAASGGFGSLGKRFLPAWAGGGGAAAAASSTTSSPSPAVGAADSSASASASASTSEGNSPSATTSADGLARSASVTSLGVRTTTTFQQKRQQQVRSATDIVDPSSSSSRGDYFSGAGGSYGQGGPYAAAQQGGIGRSASHKSELDERFYNSVPAASTMPPPSQRAATMGTYHQQPGGYDPAAWVRTASPAPMHSNSFGPRTPGIYAQTNHSSPALAGPVGFVPMGDDIPPVPSVDDLGVGLENMRFQQREQPDRAPSRSSYRQLSTGHGGGQDGAMEIRGMSGGPTSSVYSQAPPSRQATLPMHGAPPPGHRRRDSQTSVRTFNNGGVDPHRDSQGESSYMAQDPAYAAAGGYPMPGYDPQGVQGYYDDGGAPGGYYDPRMAGYGGGTPQHFQQQPGGWGYDPMQAAQNPYYAAAIAQGGFDQGQMHPQYGNAPSLPPPNGTMPSGGARGYGPGGGGGLHRAASSASSLKSMNAHMAPPQMQGWGNQQQGLGRSMSSVQLAPANGGYGAGQPPRRRPTGSTQGSRGNNNEPPITKQSVDDYRARIKADPDPEAQFNFAKFLIEAAKKISSSASGDEKAAKKYRDALLAESLKLIKRLATQGVGLGKPAYADAQFFLANCLGNGSLGLQVDHEKAYNLYVQASKQNHSAATYRTAVCNEVGAGTRKDHARAVLFYRKASALGDTAGMYKLGMILLNGLLGQQRNLKEAAAWLRRAASQADEDNPHALHELGLLFEKAPVNGQFVQHDPVQARELYTQAAQFGYPPSQYRLGSCYEFGSLTCPIDPRRSIAWYTRAAERGDAQSELALSGWYLTGSEGVLKQSDSEAYLWARRAANKGLAKAEYAVGYYSEVGIGVKQDLEEAKRWYMRAAAQGNKRAMQRLTELKVSKSQRNPGKQVARPTRAQASNECIIS